MLIFIRRPQYIKNAPSNRSDLVFETLRILRNINFNVPLYATVLRKTIGGIHHSCST
jgi:hypothetical protein